MKQELTIERLQEIAVSSPMIHFLGIRIVAAHAEDGSVSMTMPMRPELERLPDSGQFHGGAIASFIDVAGDFAIAVSLGGVVPTINLRIDYLRPAGAGALRADARTRRLGKTVGVVDVDIFDAEARLVAIGRGTYSAQTG